MHPPKKIMLVQQNESLKHNNHSQLELRRLYNFNRKKKIPNLFLMQQIIKKAKNLNDSKKLNISNLFGRINEQGEIDINILTMNVHGFGNNKICINERSYISDVVVIQETMCPNQKAVLKHIENKKLQVFHVPGRRLGSKGRYSGGLAFLVNPKINCEFESITSNIAILNINKVAILNIYMPYYKSELSDNSNEYELTIKIIEGLIIKLKHKQKEIILCGDFNTDFIKHSSYSKSLIEMANRTDICPIDVMQPQTTDYTYMKKYRSEIITSWIDHVFILKSCTHRMKYIKILANLNNNVSDHLPITMIYQLNINGEHKTIINDENLKIKEINWQDPLLREYYYDLVEKNSAHITSKYERFINCDDEEEKSIRSAELFNEISSTLISANKKTYEYNEILKQKDKKSSKSNHKQRKNWWNEQLNELHKFKCFKYILYRDSKPQPWDPRLRPAYVKAKNEFNNFKKFVEKENSNIKFKRLNELFKSDINGFWREVKKMQQIKQMINVPLKDIRVQYNQLFNTSNQPDEQRDEYEENKLKNLISNFKESKSCRDKINIQTQTVSEIIQNLKNGKAVGFSGVSNEMLKYGKTNGINLALTHLMEWMINEAIMPKLFNISILKPLIKDITKDSNNLNNLRPLSISDLYTNIFEKLILFEIRRDHPDHEKQFGFKANSSCSHATFILSETLKYCKKLNKTTYVISIDASKAFDKVSRTKLWITMFELKIRSALIIALMVYYSNYYIIVNNDRNYAAPFITTYGVKQGGCISPDLYKIYSEIIAIQISNLKLGITYGQMNIDILMYADDIILMASTIQDAQKMLDEVTKFGETHQIKFNPTKTNLLIYSSKKVDKSIDLLLCNQKIIRTSTVKYLGTELADNYSNKQHIQKRKAAVFSSLGNLISTGVINEQMNVYVKMSLFKTYLKPLLYYGIELIDLNVGEMVEMKRIEGNLLKKVIGMSKCCRSEPVYGALGLETAEENIKHQQYKFIKRAQENMYLNQFIKHSLDLKNNYGLLGKITKNLSLENQTDLEAINIAMEKDMINIKAANIDRFLFNPEVLKIREILQIKNSFLRRSKLNSLLYFSSYKQGA